MTTPTWYDILGVAPDASPEEIKSAWRAATDKFEPGSGTSQFRLFNEAADTLLDPARRAAYDAALGVGDTEEPISEPGSEPTAAEQAHGASGTEGAATTERTAVRPVAEDRAEPASTGPTVTEPAKAGPTNAGPTNSESTGLRVPWWALALLALLVLASYTVYGVLAYQTSHRTYDQEAGVEAMAAAQKALPAILSYDYRHLQANREQALAFMTPGYKPEYNKTFDIVQGTPSQPGGAEQTKAVVNAMVRAEGVQAAQPDVVQLVVFVDQSAVKNGGTPAISLNRLGVTMKKSGNQWLVSNISSF